MKNITNGYFNDNDVDSVSIGFGEDEKIARYDGTGKIQGSTVTLKDNGNMLDLNAIQFTTTSNQFLNNQLISRGDVLEYEGDNVVTQSGASTINNFPVYNSNTGQITDSGFNISNFPSVEEFDTLLEFRSNGVGSPISRRVYFIKFGKICTAVVRGIIRDHTSENTWFYLCGNIPPAYRPLFNTDQVTATIKSTTAVDPALNTESDVMGGVRLIGGTLQMYIYKQWPINDVPDYNFQWTEENSGYNDFSITYVIA